MRAHSVILWEESTFFWTVRLPFFLASFKFFFSATPCENEHLFVGKCKTFFSWVFSKLLLESRVLSFHTKWTPQNFLKVCNNKQPNWSRLHFNGSSPNQDDFIMMRKQEKKLYIFFSARIFQTAWLFLENSKMSGLGLLLLWISILFSCANFILGMSSTKIWILFVYFDYWFFYFFTVNWTLL